LISLFQLNGDLSQDDLQKKCTLYFESLENDVKKLGHVFLGNVIEHNTSMLQ